VTFAWRAGQFPARPLSSDFRIGRTPAFACAGVLSALNAQANLIISALTWQSPLDALATLGGIAAVIWIAMYAALKLGFEEPSQRVGPNDAFLLCFVIGLCLVPVSLAGQAGLLLCAGLLFWRSRSGEPARRVALILFALTGPLMWGRILLQLLATPLLALDAHIAATVAGTDVQGNLVQFADSGRRFLIGAQCSSVHNISLAIVLWTTAAALFNLRVDKRYVAVGAAMVALMFALNIVRLATMALLPAKFDMLHTGAGADLFGWAGLIGAALLAASGVTSAVRRQR
jgi:exosortase/archaeosortase family protein